MKPKWRIRFRNGWKDRYNEAPLTPVVYTDSLCWKDKIEYIAVESIPTINIQWLGFGLWITRGTKKEWADFLRQNDTKLKNCK